MQHREPLRAYERDETSHISGRATDQQSQALGVFTKKLHGSFAMDSKTDASEVISNVKKLEKAGLYFNTHKVHTSIAMDNYAGVQPTITTPSAVVPIQWLQSWQPGHVGIVTAKRKATDIIGKTVIGDFGTEQVVIKTVELAGTPGYYGDLNDVNFSGWNMNYSAYSAVRFSGGFRSNTLENLQASRIQEDPVALKRSAVLQGFAILQNDIAFYGYNNGTNMTNGFLNVPNLTSPFVLPEGDALSSNWNYKTVAEIINDIKLLFSNLVTQSQGNFDSVTDKCVLVLPLNISESLTGITNQSTNVETTPLKWLTINHPNCRIEKATQLNNAVGGLDVVYLFAEDIKDEVSTDDGRVFMQVVPASLYMLGVVPDINGGFKEAQAFSTVGTICKRPFLTVRATMDDGPEISGTLVIKSEGKKDKK